MRKVLFLLALLSVLVSCSKDDDKEESKLKFLQIKMKYDTDGVGPKGDIFLFYLKDEFPDKNRKPFFFEYEKKSMCAITDVNGEYIYHTYKRSFSPSKDENTGKYKNESSSVIYLGDGENDLSLPKGVDLEGDYLIVIKLNNGSYGATYKYITLTESTILEKTFTRDPEETIEFEEW